MAATSDLKLHMGTQMRVCKILEKDNFFQVTGKLSLRAIFANISEVGICEFKDNHILDEKKFLQNIKDYVLWRFDSDFEQGIEFFD